MTRAGGPPPTSPFDHLPEIRERLAGGGATLVALDFDGTLTEIEDDPEAPGLTDERRTALARIPGAGRRLAIVSGRALDDVRRRVGVPEAIVIGNHGLEIEGPGIRIHPPEAVAQRLAAVLATVGRAIESGNGGADARRAWIEDKQWTASVHTRPRGDAAHHAEIGRAIEPLVRAAGFDLRPGKATWEVRPAGARDKGTAILALLDALPGASAARTLYAGDDATDEDAFRALAAGVTVKVGADPAAADRTAAHYGVDSPADVYRLLEALFPADA